MSAAKRAYLCFKKDVYLVIFLLEFGIHLSGLIKIL